MSLVSSCQLFVLFCGILCRLYCSTLNWLVFWMRIYIGNCRKEEQGLGLCYFLVLWVWQYSRFAFLGEVKFGSFLSNLTSMWMVMLWLFAWVFGFWLGSWIGSLCIDYCKWINTKPSFSKDYSAYENPFRYYSLSARISLE